MSKVMKFKPRNRGSLFSNALLPFNNCDASPLANTGNNLKLIHQALCATQTQTQTTTRRETSLSANSRSGIPGPWSEKISRNPYG
jgi:hypothetical protein